MLIKLKAQHLQFAGRVEKVDGKPTSDETLTMEGELLWDSNTLLIDDDRVLCSAKEYESKYALRGDDESNYRIQMGIRLALRRQTPDWDNYLMKVCESLKLPDALNSAIGVLGYYSSQENLYAEVYLDPQTYDSYREMALRRVGPLQVSLAWFYLSGVLDKDFFLKSLSAREVQWTTGRNEESYFIANMPISDFSMSQLAEPPKPAGLIEQILAPTTRSQPIQTKSQVSSVGWFALGAAFAFLLSKCS